MTTEPASPVQLSPWPTAQRRIGLTGGIASGKSSVSHYLAEKYGLPVLDADAYAREALAPGSAATKAVLDRYGSAVTEASPHTPASIDRSTLGRIVFSDALERRWLESLVHPIVRQRFETELVNLQNKAVVVMVIPLLFEAELESLCNEIWVVHCSASQQLQRLMHRDQLSKPAAEARLAAQWPLETKTALADTVIDNTGAAEKWVDQVSHQIERLLIDAR